MNARKRRRLTFVLALLAGATAAVAAGSIQLLSTGHTFAPQYADLVGVEHTVDPAYRFNPSTRWMFSDATLKQIKLLLDTAGRPLWQPGLTASFRDGAAVDMIAARPTILDHPYVINQDMATPAANANQILFGDLGGEDLGVAGLLPPDEEGHKCDDGYDGDNNEDDLFHARFVLRSLQL